MSGTTRNASGFARALAQTFGPAPRGPFALIGAGGVGKAIAVALAGFPGAEIRIFDTDGSKVRGIAAALGDSATVRVCERVEEAVSGAGGLVNGTPIGMLPNRDSPVPANLLRNDMWVADAVYSPLWTPLLQLARQAGSPVMTGRELAIHQALDAFRLFTGREVPKESMEAAFDAVMAAREATAAA